ncbi:putative NADH-flavin reductase [Microbacterium sp. W4I4]|uniref:NAD(P)-dependent oxidoreductase n=1 Tax=Microbacterium sp. W4I4 TaxID=3042295 RepID=UPI002787CE34|nr:NAD(P)H-binding protein [Microbacterium sp. W4I4]MDQ0612718.1 putative NADH-flavin reductase [Microbacterium sp. W4I4]
MKFLVLGATGRTGALFIRKALDQGHRVTALVRRADAAIDSRADVVSGDVTDAALLAEAAAGHDAIISALGVRSAKKTPSLITDMVRAVIDSVKVSGVDRFVLVSAFGVGESLDKASFLVSPLFRTMLRRPYADKAASEVLLKASDLRWTLEYPGALNDGKSTRYDAVTLEKAKKLPLFPTTSRTNVAEFLLDTAVQGGFVRQTVVVTDAR